MILVNGTPAKYKFGIHGAVFNSAQNPTGFGGAGLFLDLTVEKVFISLKYNLLQVHTTKTSNFINIDNSYVEQYETFTYNESNYKFPVNDVNRYIKFNIDQFEIKLDVVALGSILYKQPERYGKINENILFRNFGTKYSSIFVAVNKEVNQAVDYIGIIAVDGQEEWLYTINGQIVSKDRFFELLPDFWIFKLDMLQNTLKNYSNNMIYESIMLEDTTKEYTDLFSYINYFTKQNEALSVPLYPVSFDVEKISDDEIMQAFNISNVEEIPASYPLGRIPLQEKVNKDGDVAVMLSSYRIPGINKKGNFLTIGYRETRNAFYDLKKGNTLKNVGYFSKDGNIGFGDNFYFNLKANAKELPHIDMPDYINQFAGKETDVIDVDFSERFKRFVEELNKEGADFKDIYKTLARKIKIRLGEVEIKEKKDVQDVIYSLLKYEFRNYATYDILKSYIDEVFFTFKLEHFATDEDHNIVAVVNPWLKKIIFYDYQTSTPYVKKINKGEYLIKEFGQIKYGSDGKYFYWNGVPYKIKSKESGMVTSNVIFQEKKVVHRDDKDIIYWIPHHMKMINVDREKLKAFVDYLGYNYDNYVFEIKNGFLKG